MSPVFSASSLTSQDCDCRSMFRIFSPPFSKFPDSARELEEFSGRSLKTVRTLCDNKVHVGAGYAFAKTDVQRTGPLVQL